MRNYYSCGKKHKISLDTDAASRVKLNMTSSNYVIPLLCLALLVSERFINDFHYGRKEDEYFDACEVVQNIGILWSRAQPIGHVNNISLMQFYTGIPRTTHSKLYIYIYICGH